MATWFDQYWGAVKSVIETTWPEIPAGQLFMDTNLERYDWINLLNGGQLSGVWSVVKMDFQPYDQGVPDYPCWQVVPTIHYITPLAVGASGDASVKTAAEFISRKLVLLSQAFLASQNCGTVLTSTVMGINASDEINVGLLGAKLPYQAGSLQVTSIIDDAGDT